MSVHVLIVGGGRVGAALATLLLDAAHQVTIVERRDEVVAGLRNELPSASLVQADGTDPVALEGAGIRRADVVAAVTGDDACNLVACSLARNEFRAPRTIARVVDPAHAWAFGPDLGVDVALDQADLLARLTLEEMSLGEVATLMKLRRGDLTLVEERLAPDARAVGRTIGELSLPPTSVVMAVIRGGEALPALPSRQLEAGDELLAVVHAGDVVALGAELGGVPDEP